jgi:hypothetical protein
MLRSSASLRNTFLTSSRPINPISTIRSGPRWWSDPERMVRHKVLQFTLGLDQLALRRTAVIQADKKRLSNVKWDRVIKKTDATRYRTQRFAQMSTWYKRIQYQEYYIQHLTTRHMWGQLRMYPSGGAKIAGKADQGYFGYDSLAVNRYNREPLPAAAKELYPRRK